MPFKSDKQRKLMYAVANSPAVAKKTGISKAVADKFIEHKAEGGTMATKKFRKDDDMAYKAKERRHVEAMKKAGIKGKVLEEEKREAGLKKGGVTKKYALGGVPGGEMSPDDMAQVAESLKKEAETRRSRGMSGTGAGGIGNTTVGFKKGGRIDGFATKGKTKGRMV